MSEKESVSEQREKILFDQYIDIEYDLYSKLHTLIDAFGIQTL
jgi:hypothetical protein